MFTGLVEEVGSVISITGTREFKSLTIKADKVLLNSLIGDSIAINGVCQTIVLIENTQFSVHILKESLEKTNLSILRKGKKVNLERALTLNKPLGGHLVQGHVQETATVLALRKTGENSFLSLKLSDKLMSFMVEEGSITVDGLSLTICNIKKNIIFINIIPHTLNSTTVGQYKVGDIVNIEPDFLIKSFSRKDREGLTKKKLHSWGY